MDRCPHQCRILLTQRVTRFRIRTSTLQPGQLLWMQWRALGDEWHWTYRGRQLQQVGQRPITGSDDHDPRSGGPTPKFYLNFSNPRTQAWWLDEYVGPALDNPDIDGVYTDCSCGSPRGETPTAEELRGREKAARRSREQG